MGAAGVGLSGVGKGARRGLAEGSPNRARRQFITLGWLERRAGRVPKHTLPLSWPGTSCSHPFPRVQRQLQLQLQLAQLLLLPHDRLVCSTTTMALGWYPRPRPCPHTHHHHQANTYTPQPP